MGHAGRRYHGPGARTHEDVGEGRLLERLLEILVPPDELAPHAHELLHLCGWVLDLAHCEGARLGPIIGDDGTTGSEEAGDNEELKELRLVLAQVELVGQRLEDAQVRLVVVRVRVGAQGAVELVAEDCRSACQREGKRRGEKG